MAFDSREYEYADTKVSIFGAELSGLRGLTYKQSQEKELVYGAGNDAKAIQRGNKKNEGSLMLLKSDYDQLCKVALASGYQSLIDVPGNKINITCTYCKADNLVKATTDSLLNVEFSEVEDGMKQGDKFKEITLPFIFLKQKKV